ncbi:MAG: NTP transferase domain-containing protein [Bacillus subtilis]|nr:NTP transferase domain-containing protein [Bacillus subtilis]
MIDINGKPMASYVVKGILDSGRVSRVIVSGPEELAGPLAQFGESVKLVKPGANLLDSLLNALEATETDRVVIGTADIPLVDGAAIRDMIELCDKQEAEVILCSCLQRGLREGISRR